MLHRPIHAAGAYLNLYFCEKGAKAHYGIFEKEL